MYNNNCIFNPSFICPMMRSPYSNMNMDMGLNYNYNNVNDYNSDITYENPFNPVGNGAFNIKFKRVSLDELVD